MWAWPGSRDDDNSTVQTAAMGQIPRSTERILVYLLFVAEWTGPGFMISEHL